MSLVLILVFCFIHFFCCAKFLVRHRYTMRKWSKTLTQNISVYLNDKKEENFCLLRISGCECICFLQKILVYPSTTVLKWRTGATLFATHWSTIWKLLYLRSFWTLLGFCFRFPFRADFCCKPFNNQFIIVQRISVFWGPRSRSFDQYKYVRSAKKSVSCGRYSKICENSRKICGKPRIVLTKKRYL